MCLRKSAESIIGSQTAGVKNISVLSNMTPESIKNDVQRVINELICDDGLIVFADMPGGTPMNIVLPLISGINKYAVICGVNLNMLTSAFTYRKTLNFDALTAKVIEDGKKAICEVKVLKP